MSEALFFTRKPLSVCQTRPVAWRRVVRTVPSNFGILSGGCLWAIIFVVVEKLSVACGLINFTVAERLILVTSSYSWKL